MSRREEVLKNYIRILLSGQDEKFLTKFLGSIQALRLFQVNPKIQVGYGTYEEDDLGIYRQIIENQNLIPERIISRIIKKSEGEWFRGYETSFFMNEELLFKVPFKAKLLIEIGNTLVISHYHKERGSSELQLWRKVEEKFKCVSVHKFTYREYAFSAGNNDIILIGYDKGWYERLKVEDYKFQKVTIPDHIELYPVVDYLKPQRSETVPDLIPLKFNEFALVHHGRIVIYDDDGVIPKEKQEIKGFTEGTRLARITSDIFAVCCQIGDSWNYKLYRRQNGKFYLFQIFEGEGCYKIQVISPDKKEVKRLAQLLPCQLPLDLKILTTEFCISN